jgi:hypothetical protein
LQIPHSLASPELQDLITPAGDHRSPLPADKRRRPMPFAPPHRRPVVLVRPCPLLLAQHLPCDPLEISGNTLLPSSHRRTIGEHATASSRVRFARGGHAGMRAQQAAQAGCLAGLGYQAMAQPAFQLTARGRPPRPMGSSLRPVSARNCAADFKCFFNCFKSQKLVQIFKIH